jgi:Transposase
MREPGAPSTVALSTSIRLFGSRLPRAAPSVVRGGAEWTGLSSELRDTVVATVRVPGESACRHEETCTFGTTLPSLMTLLDWLGSHQVTLVGMEATGVYWKPVYYVLEDAVECWLLNARHLKAVPGRKTDVADSAWIAQLVEHGLVRPSFVPPKPIRELRDLTRYRKAQIQERSREAQRLDKVLQDAGLKLSSVATDILGKSGRPCSRRWWGERPIRRSSPSWPGAGCAPSCRRCEMRSRDASAATTRSSSARSSRTSTTSTRPSSDSPRRSGGSSTLSHRR